MKKRFLFAAALFSVAGPAAAQDLNKLTQVSKLKQQAKALQKQNEALEKRLRRLEQQQARQEKKINSREAAAPAQQPAPTPIWASSPKGPSMS